MATKKGYFLKKSLKKLKFSKCFYCFLGSQSFCHLPIEQSLDRQWLPEDLQEVEVALPTPNQANSSQEAASYVERQAFCKTKRTPRPKRSLHCCQKLQ